MYALILAGGRGERLRPLTDTIPKPMLPLAERPILWHQVRWLRTCGVTDVVFLVGHRAESIADYFGDGAAFGVRAHYSRETTPLGRGGALRLGMKLLPPGYDRPLMALNGDIVTDADPAVMLDAFQARLRVNPEQLAAILTVRLTSPYGIVESDCQGVITRFREKAALPYDINGGVYVFHPAIRDWLPEQGDHEVSAFPRLAAQGRMLAVRTERFWRSIDSFKDLADAEAHLTAKR